MRYPLSRFLPAAHVPPPFGGMPDAASFRRILIMGDSITHHAPKADLGWSGDWGMAASSAENDYVHLFLAALATAQGATASDSEVWIVAKGGGKIPEKLALAEQITAFQADLALIQLGENDQEVSREGFQEPYQKLLETIRAGRSGIRLLCSGVWGAPNGDRAKNDMIQAVCEKLEATFVDLHAATIDPANHALSEGRFTDPGVNWHPGDRGMRAYAKAFLNTLGTAWFNAV